MRHDSIPHGSGGRVAISVILTEVRFGVGGDSGTPHVRDGIELIDVLKMGSNNMGFQAFYFDDDAPLALRAIRGHKVVEAKSTLMEWRKVTAASETPRLYHGARFCNINSTLDHGMLPGKATGSGRSDYDWLQRKGLGEVRPP